MRSDRLRLAIVREVAVWGQALNESFGRLGRQADHALIGTDIAGAMLSAASEVERLAVET
jgi:hypothetical protein